MKKCDKMVFSYRRIALFAGVSAAALLAQGANSTAIAAGAAELLAPASLMQATGPLNTTASVQAGPLASAAVQAQIALSTTNLRRAQAALANVGAAQAAARAAAAASSQLTLNGAPLSGLTLDPNSPAISASYTKPADPTQTTATVVQTAKNAVVTWTSLDLARGETLKFDQAGNADWTILNRILGSNTNQDGHSIINGKVTADGAVYFINANGIIFGPNTQINVHSLIASSLDVGGVVVNGSSLTQNSVAQRNSFFINNGILGATGTSTSFSYDPNRTTVEGNVTVMQGATITASLAPQSVSSDAGGFVYLFAPNVENDGTISAPAGEIMMVAAQQLQLTPNAYPDHNVANFRAVGPNFQLIASSTQEYPWRIRTPGTISATDGRVVNTGLIESDRGVVVLNGEYVLNGQRTDFYNNPSTGATTAETTNGVIKADTSITRNSEIFLDARVALTLDSGSSVQILPDENGDTIPASALTSSSFIAGSVEMRGNIVDLESSAQIEAPGASVTVYGIPQSAETVNYPGGLKPAIPASHIYMAADSVIDVSGLDGVTLPITDNLISFKPFGNEFADQPLQRQGALRGQTLTVDIRQSGVYNGSAWIGTPLADVSSLANTIPRTIDQLLTTGGSVTFASTGLNEQIVLRSGSVINVAGGYVQYTGGFVQTTNLLTADGRIVNIANADPLVTYVGIAGVGVLQHLHWGDDTKQTFVDSLLAGGQYQAGYVEGQNAGSITLANSSSEYALDGSYDAGVIVGELQRAAGNKAAMPVAGSFVINGLTDLDVQKTVAPLSVAGFDAMTTLPSGIDATTDYSKTTLLSADVLSSAGFGQIIADFSQLIGKVLSGGSLTVEPDAVLTVSPGGTISFKAVDATINGDLIARSGTISVETKIPFGLVTVTDPTPPGLSNPNDQFNLTIGPGAVLDASGLWVNDTSADQETLIGGAYVNGGTISLKTDTSVAACASAVCRGNPRALTQYVDLTGNIVLQAGSELDVSSGGRVGVNGKFAVDSEGRAVGTGGNVVLATYADGFSAANGIPTTSNLFATILFGGSDGSAVQTAAAFGHTEATTIKAFGFAQGGTLTIQAPTIDIVADDGGTGALNLPAGFFAANGFSAYNLTAVGGASTSVTGNLTVESGAVVSLKQRNFVASADLLTLPTGSDVTLWAQDGYLPDSIRSSVALTLTSDIAPLPLPPTPYVPPASTSQGGPSAAGLVIDAGAVIAGDPGAAISLNVSGRESVVVPLQNSAVGNIAAQTGVAEIFGSVRAPGGTITVTGGTYSEIWLGASSRLDASGVVVVNDLQPAYRAGSVLPGGEVEITSTASTSALIGLAGAVIDVSGAVGAFDIVQDTTGSALPGRQLTRTPEWSDAGAITLSAATLLYDGTFAANPGAVSGVGEGRGGALTVALPGAAKLTVQQSSLSDTQQSSLTANQIQYLAGLGPTDRLIASSGLLSGTTLQNQAVFQAGQLSGSGLSDLTLAAGAPVTEGASVSLGTVQFSGNITIGGLDGLWVEGSTIALAGIPISPSSPAVATKVDLSARYVALEGTGSGSAAAGMNMLNVTATSTNVSAGMIDILAGGANGGAITLSGVAMADFSSDGDIRLGVPLGSGFNNLAGALAVGELDTTAQLMLEAAQVYPESDVGFTLKSSGTITIAGNSNSKTARPPYSAGGRVTLSATNINQDGSLLAPLGVINLVATQNVTLGAGSITQVSLDGQVVPFGETTDGKNWSYDSENGTPLTGAPQKAITISGVAISIDAKATVDLSGGGDIQASEFVPGTGGQRNVLANTSTTADTTDVYAIIPGYNPGAAPIDFDFLAVGSTTRQGDPLPSPGSGIYLTASPGLKAGYYTLLPAHYATLPGAYRVQMVAGSRDVLASDNTVLPDGTLQVAGNFAQGSSGARDSRTTLFDVQSSSVWRQYTEIDQTSGDAYFGALAQSATAAPARLPRDAGHIVINVLPSLPTLPASLNLGAPLKTDPAPGGAGAEFDLVGTNLQILAAFTDALAPGAVGIEASQLAALGADSLLVGGQRNAVTGGEAITVSASNIEIDQGAVLDDLPEIILVANGGPTGSRAAISLDKNSAVSASGTLAAGDTTNYVIGNTATAGSGDGALIAVSSGAPVTLQRLGATKGTGDFSIGSGAAITGTAAGAITLDSTGTHSQIAPDAVVTARQISISNPTISFGHDPSAAGLVLSDTAVNQTSVIDQLALAKTLIIRSLNTLQFYGDITIELDQAGSLLSLDATGIAPNGGNVTLAANLATDSSAGTVALTDSFGTSSSGATTMAPMTGTLTVQAGNVLLGAGAKAFSGFGTVGLTGTSQIAVRGTGSLDVGAAVLTLDTPLLLVGGGAAQTVTTTGSATLKNSEGTVAPATSTLEIGGTLALTASSIADSTVIQATAGGLTLDATTGDIALAATAKIKANGFAQSFFDTTRVASGGSVKLIADQGDIDAAKGSAINIGSPAGWAGNAGDLTLSAASGTLNSGGDAFDTAIIAGSLAADSGGRLTIDAGSLGTASLAIPSVFGDTVDIHVHTGDLSLASDLTAQTVTLTTDTGTLTVGTTIDASGTKGGTISLFGGAGVTLAANGALLATASDPAKHGGAVVIGTETAGTTGLPADGVIDLAGGRIDVSNTADAANGGTVRLRAPLQGDYTNANVAINPIVAKITGAASVTVEAFKVYDATSGFSGSIDPANNPGFYGSCNAAGACTGTLISFVQNFALAPRPDFTGIANLHLQPGIELVSTGDITINSAWNLGAGIAGNLVNISTFTDNNKNPVPAGQVVTDAYGNLLPQYSQYSGQLAFIQGTSQITDLFYRTDGGSPTGEPGALTLRAAGNININASITDGFFQTENRLDAAYLSALNSWVNSNKNSATLKLNTVGGTIIAGPTGQAGSSGDPLPPFDKSAGSANSISPVTNALSSSNDKIAAADLFPLINGNPIGSWSYRIVAGADTSSADPLAVQTAAALATATAPLGHGDIVFGGAALTTQSSVLKQVYVTPTMVRTGTGSIDMAAGRDFKLGTPPANPTDTSKSSIAMGAVYTAGANSPDLPDPDYAGNSPQNPSGFLAPEVLELSCAQINFCYQAGPITAAAYPVNAGHLTVTAQRDIVGVEQTYLYRTVSGNTLQTQTQQYFASWLFAQGTSLTNTVAGIFAPQSFAPSQTSWWINFGSFDQGLMSAGGDVRVVAGNDITQLGVSLPTTLRVSGGLSATIPDGTGGVVANVPAAHLNPSGDLTVIAGGDINSGAFYEGSGQASITAGGSVQASWNGYFTNQPKTTSPTASVSTVLAVDTGQISLSAHGSVDIAGVVSGASLQDVADSTGIDNPTGSVNSTIKSAYLSSYGQDSAVAVESASGEIVVNSLGNYFNPHTNTGGALSTDASLLLIQNSAGDTAAFRGVSAYPASFEAVALAGDITIADSLQLAPSDTGALDLLAYGSLDTQTAVNYWTGQYPSPDTGRAGQYASRSDQFQALSTGPSLVEATFNPVEPLAGFGPSSGSSSLDLGAHLVHENDPNPDLFYAVNGDIVSGQGLAVLSNSAPTVYPLSWEIDKPADVRAGRDIIDLPFFGENLAPTDVTQISAGRDIFYTGTLHLEAGIFADRPDLPQQENAAGLSLAGPGFFDIEAGRNLGPFVTAAADGSEDSVSKRYRNDSNGTGIITFGNSVTVGNRLMTVSNDVATLTASDDAFAKGPNILLPRQGASITALFGVGKGIDYQGVIKAYVDPATATSAHDYGADLVTFLQTLGMKAQSEPAAWTSFAGLPAKLQDIFADQVFFKELDLASKDNQYAPGYAVIGTLFPVSDGYTDNGADVTGPVTQVATGDLEMLHATIKTLQSTTVTVQNADGGAGAVAVGGDVLLLGPGGNIDVGSQAKEINTNLTTSALGVLTLDNGVIDSFTDGSLLVSQSRVLTVEGGDILLWSSNADLDAGRGVKTTIDYTPLTVAFNPDDLQTINLNGLVSGAGIGTIQATPDAPPASATLIAPRGTVNAGDAGLRSSGNLTIIALRVLNAANISALGAVTGVPQVNQVNLGSLESASSTAGAGTQAALAAVAAASKQAPQPVRRLPSLITVEVLGFGDCDPDNGQKCPE